MSKSLFDLIEEDNGDAIIEAYGEEGMKDINTPSANNELAIIKAAKENKHDAFSALVFCGAKLNVCDKDGTRLLDILCEMNSIKMIKSGNRVNKFRFDYGPDMNGETPVVKCAKKSYNKIIKRILFRTDVNTCDMDGNTALHYAVLSGNLDLVNLLFKEFDMHGKVSDHKIKNKEGKSAYDLAVESENTLLIDAFEKQISLLETKEKYTMFFQAIKNGDLESVENSLKSGINPNHKIVNGNTGIITFALGEAVLAENKDMIELLVKNGADINFELNPKCNAMILALSNKDSEKSYEYAKFLFNLGASLYMKQKKYRILNFTINQDNSKFLNFMISKKFSFKGHVSGENLSYHLLIKSFKKYSEKCADMVFDNYKINVSRLDKRGNSLLHMAASYGKLKHFEKLIKSGALLDLKNEDGQTAKDIVSFARPEKFVKVINKYENKYERI